MSIEILISILALLVAIVAAVAAVAGLTDEGRTRFTQWTKTAASKTYRVGRSLFLLLSLANGVVGVVFFGLDPTLPTRKDILTLLLFLINIGIGIFGLYRLLEQYVTSRAQRPAEV